MAEDIFKYSPISEWNGNIVDFGMPSTDGDIRLTEICLAADACLEAASNAIALSFTDSSFVKARSSSVQKIVRTLFGEDTGINIVTFQAVGDDGSIHFMSPMVTAAMELLGKDWEIFTNDIQSLGLNLIHYDYWTDPYDEVYRRTTFQRERHVLNPLAVGNIITGNRPIAGNWDTDGEPYFELNWDTIQFGRCSDNVQTTEGACESTVLGGYCREGFGTGRGYCSNSTYRNNETLCLSFGTCSDPTYNDNESGCVGNSNVWSFTNTWSSSEGTPPRAIKKDNGTCDTPVYDGNESSCPTGQWHAVGFVEANIDYYGDGHCLLTAGWSSGQSPPFPNGKCFYQYVPGGGPNTDDLPWIPYTNNNEAWCLDIAANYDPWAHLWWAWIPPQNDWTDIHAVWRPSYDGNHTDVHGNSDFIQGTVDSWKHFNIKTADNHRKYPINHVPSQTGTNLRIYHSDSNSSWGDGTEVGRSTIPLWITNSFEWADNDLTYDYCHDSGGTPADQWSSRSGYYDHGYACLAAGDCTGEYYPGNYHNDQAACETMFLCSDHSLDNNNDSYACLNNDCCSGGGPGSPTWGWPYSSSWGSNGSPYTCGGAGTCVWNSNFHNHEQYCNWYGSGATTANGGWVPGYYSWGPNHCGRSWYQANTFTSEGNTWDAVSPDVEVEMPIAGDYLWKPAFPPHTFVDTTNSRPVSEYGYTTSLTIPQPDFSKIRWKPPQGDGSPTPDYNRTYPRPSKFRIYRAPAWYGIQTAVTDFTEQIWKLAGEVKTRSDSGYHYFYDTREDMFKEGLREFQHAYYGITAVWEDWNWKRGYTINLYDDMSGPAPSGSHGGCEDWDIYHGQTWSAVVGNVMYSGKCSNTNYITQATCEGNGACIGNSNYNNNVILCLSFGTCSDPTYDNDEVGCIGAVGTWTPLYTWSSSNYTWIIGQWTGTVNSGANLDNIENATPMGGYPQLKSAVQYSSLSNHRTYRASGYLRAPVTGTYYFQVRGDDGVFMWLGSNGQTVSTLVSNRTWYNYTAAVPGLHGIRYNYYPDSATTLTEGHVYPILAYGGNHTGGFAFDIRIYYPSGDWNDNSSGEWKYVPIDIMPEDMDPGTDGDGQTVEGHWAVTTVPAWYTNYP